jgi:hypothetical protein
MTGSYGLRIEAFEQSNQPPLQVCMKIEIRLVEDDCVAILGAEEVRKQLQPDLHSVSDPKQLSVAMTSLLTAEEI